jgi:MFS family permease
LPASATHLDRAAVGRAMRLSLLEGMAYALMVGAGEAYFLAYAIRLGAGALEQGLVVSLPLFTGAAGPLLSIGLLARLRRRKTLVVASTALQAATLFALAAAEASGLGSPALLIAAASLYQVFGQTTGTGWASWYGDLVPQEERGRYFARRNRAVHAATCAGLLAGGTLLQVLEPARAAAAEQSTAWGFVLVFALAGLARLVSVALLASSAEPRFQGLSDRMRVGRFLRTSRGSDAWRLLSIGASLQLVVYVAAPYFTPFMLEELSFSYIEYTVASLSIVLFKVLFLPVWGTQIDQLGGARNAHALSMLMLALIPLPWLWTEGLGWVVFAQSFSGLAWAGYEISQFALLLESSYRRMRVHLFAAQSLFNGTAQLVGGLFGALLVGLAAHDLRVVFAVSMAGRVLLALLVPRLLPAPAGAPVVARRDLLLRVIGVRPNGGLVHRPVGPPASHAGPVDPLEPAPADGERAAPSRAGSSEPPGPGTRAPR